ncbi:hypothetical protein F5I97DRAFT_1801718 [Phlebopus sp. FC_14]|nr:hypothetical protein F5I97DRAFT_1801718 [Phlebopus sp. FC_14]
MHSHNCGHLTKIWAIYLKSCGLSAHTFDILHGLDILMSHKWTTNTYSILVEHEMKVLWGIIFFFIFLYFSLSFCDHVLI